MPSSVTINGVICDLHGRTISGPVKIVGEMYVGSAAPPPNGGGIWPPPHPEHPIPPIPSHPIVLPPDPPTEPPIDPPTNPPSDSWEWGWTPAYGWHPVYVPGDKPQPVPPG